MLKNESILNYIYKINLEINKSIVLKYRFKYVELGL